LHHALCCSAPHSPQVLELISGTKKTIVTFGEDVEIPGQILSAGTYVFRLADNITDRHIVQIWTANQSQILTTIMTIPYSRLQPRGGLSLNLTSAARARLWPSKSGCIRATPQERNSSIPAIPTSIPTPTSIRSSPFPTGMGVFPIPLNDQQHVFQHLLVKAASLFQRSRAFLPQPGHAHDRPAPTGKGSRTSCNGPFRGQTPRFTLSLFQGNVFLSSLRRFDVQTLQLSTPHRSIPSPLCSTTHKLCNLQPLSFDVLTNARGHRGNPYRDSRGSPLFGAILFPFIFLPTILRKWKTQLFSFQAIPHSLSRTPEVRGTLTRRGFQERTAAENLIRRRRLEGSTVCF
jgi:hypothetical protein